jgi:hypothetical protein
MKKSEDEDGVKAYKTIMEDNDDDDLFRCAICGTAEGDSSNLTTQSSLQTNVTVGCGHQL